MKNTNLQKTTQKINALNARVAIITPTYNRSELLKKTVSSVLAQEYKDYVYIILDDGSTDNTHDVVKELIGDRRNCFYVYHDNIGEAATVNRGWRLTDCEYFLQVNSDDTIEPGLLNEMVSALDNNRNCVVAYSDFLIIDENDDVIESVNNSEWNFIDALSIFACYAAAPGAVIRKSSFKKLRTIKDPNYKYISDVKMFWNLALRGDFVYIPKRLASWRSHSSGISTDRYKSISEVLRWVDEYFTENDLPISVRAVEADCRSSVYQYCIELLEKSNFEETILYLTKYLININKIQAENCKIIYAENDNLKSTINVLNNKIQKYENSFSWKITKWPRKAKAVLNNLIK